MTARLVRRLMPIGSSLIVSAAVFAAQAPQPPPIERLKLPAGFKIAVYAEGLTNARSMALGAKGTVFVGSRAPGQVYAVVDGNGDGVGDEVKVIAKGLEQPNGVAFRDGALYVATTPRILRFDDIESKLDAPPAPVTVYDGIPAGGIASWRYLRFGPDGLLYMTIGSPCNVCAPDVLDKEPRFGSIFRMKPDGSSPEVFARGMRASMGMDWHPTTHDLWFTDNGRDGLGETVPSDELNVAPEAGLHFGYPFCHQGDVPDPDYGKLRPCSAFVPPALKFGAHVAAIGMRFYTGTMFPAAYRNAIFVAEHGSWNNTVPVGYRVRAVRVNGRRATSDQPFIDGFLRTMKPVPGRSGQADGDAFGRPVDLLTLPDGSLLVSDDGGGRIYRVTYGR